MLKAVLFDIDGVLIDSLEANLKFFQDILGGAGYPRPTREEYAKVFHLPLIDTLRHFSKPELEEELERIHEQVTTVPYASGLLTQPEDTQKTLEILSKTYALGVVSSRTRRGIDMYFAFSKTGTLFPVSIAYEDAVNHKPHPEPLLLAAKRLKVRPDECVYIGDTHTDMEAGKAAGMRTILFGEKAHPLADKVISLFAGLPQLIASL